MKQAQNQWNLVSHHGCSPLKVVDHANAAEAMPTPGHHTLLESSPFTVHTSSDSSIRLLPVPLLTVQQLPKCQLVCKHTTKWDHRINQISTVSTFQPCPIHQVNGEFSFPLHGV